MTFLDHRSRRQQPLIGIAGDHHVVADTHTVGVEAWSPRVGLGIAIPTFLSLYPGNILGAAQVSEYAWETDILTRADRVGSRGRRGWFARLNSRWSGDELWMK